jgi:hypothetical protein
MRFLSRRIFVLLALFSFAESAPAAEVGEQLERTGDEIMVCGQLFHTGAPVVLWTDPGGYDAYRTEKRFGPWSKSAFLPPTGASSVGATSMKTRRKSSGEAIPFIYSSVGC